MRIESLRYFIELVREGSFYKASKSAFISQQGLNKAISAIEKELGTKLLHRSSSGVDLTDAGTVFLAYAQKALSDYDRLLADLSEKEGAPAPDSKHHVIRATSYVLRVVTEAFYSSLDSSISIEEKPFWFIRDALESGETDTTCMVDLFQPTYRKVKESKILSVTPLFTTYIGIACARQSPLARLDTISCEGLRNVPLAYNCGDGIGTYIEQLLGDMNSYNVALTSENGSLLTDYAASGKAVSLYDSYSLYTLAQRRDKRAESLVFVPLDCPDASDTICFLSYGKRNRKSESEHVTLRIQSLFGSRYASYLARYPTITAP